MSGISRREFLVSLTLITTGLIAGCSSSINQRTGQIPNIVYILADDMGYGDIRALNAKSKIASPSLDRLVHEGMSFSDAHSNSAVCTPTRYGVLTGRYCYRSRLKSSVLYGYSPSLIEKGRTTVASLLSKQGYRTGCIGKWHLGLDWEKKDPFKELFTKLPNWQIEVNTNCDFTKPVNNGPKDFGFDYSYILPASLDMAPYVYLEDQKVTEPVTKMLEGLDSERGVFYREGEMAENFDIYATLDHFTDKAITFISESSKGQKPFFLYLPLTAPHTPWLPADGFKGKSGAGVYGDFVMHVDFSVGRIMKELDDKKIADNTIVVFTSDNGSHWTPEDIAKWSHLANSVYAGMKSDVWDGGHRVPFIVRWPAKVKAGTKSDQLICTTDWLATCAEITNYKLSDNEGEDSYSLLSVLLDKKYDKSYRHAVIHHSLSGEFALRLGEWKYIDCKGSGGWSSEGRQSDPAGQLYNMKNDPSETKNLYDKMPGKVRELKALLEKYKNQDSIAIKNR